MKWMVYKMYQIYPKGITKVLETCEICAHS